MVLKVFLSIVLFNMLSLIYCSELNDNLFGSLMGQRSWFGDLDADFELSRNKFSLKNKRFDNGVFSYNEKSDTVSSTDSDDGDSWHGRWLPEKVEPKPHRVVSKRLNDTLQQDHYSSMTSSINASCDDGKTNITVDWSGSPENFTCFQRTFISPDFNVAAFITHDYIPIEYHARHVCMHDKISYDTYLPTFGPHRPAWGRYGEYTFLPVQRWLHNLEHGAIVMLYHPCAHPLLVSKLRDIVTSCLYRHIITPYTLLSEKRVEIKIKNRDKILKKLEGHPFLITDELKLLIRFGTVLKPLALVSWGWSMTMSYVNEHNVEKFIKEHALHGFEKLSKDGDYDHMLKKPAEIITTEEDDSICPNSVKQHM